MRKLTLYCDECKEQMKNKYMRLTMDFPQDRQSILEFCSSLCALKHIQYLIAENREIRIEWFDVPPEIVD